uniref:Putative secreted protein n=1 Tax=Ixodes ricinus TaxID=34613 RepID=A0A6B0U9E2_IXORI
MPEPGISSMTPVSLHWYLSCVLIAPSLAGSLDGGACRGASTFRAGNSSPPVGLCPLGRAGGPVTGAASATTRPPHVHRGTFK